MSPTATDADRDRAGGATRKVKANQLYKHTQMAELRELVVPVGGPKTLSYRSVLANYTITSSRRRHAQTLYESSRARRRGPYIRRPHRALEPRRGRGRRSGRGAWSRRGNNLMKTFKLSERQAAIAICVCSGSRRWSGRFEQGDVTVEKIEHSRGRAPPPTTVRSMGSS